MIKTLFLSLITSALVSNCPSFSGKSSTVQILSDTTFQVFGPNYPNGISASIISGTKNPDIYTGGTHIWETSSAKSNQNSKNLTFIKSFELPTKTIKAAIIYFNVDDKAYFYLNNAYTGCFTNTWIPKAYKVCDVSGFVKSGENSFEIIAINTKGGALLSFRLEVIMIG